MQRTKYRSNLGPIDGQIDGLEVPYVNPLAHEAGGGIRCAAMVDPRRAHINADPNRDHVLVIDVERIGECLAE